MHTIWCWGKKEERERRERAFALVMALLVDDKREGVKYGWDERLH